MTNIEIDFRSETWNPNTAVQVENSYRTLTEINIGYFLNTACRKVVWFRPIYDRKKVEKCNKLSVKRNEGSMEHHPGCLFDGIA